MARKRSWKSGSCIRSETVTRRITIGLTWRRTIRKISRLKEDVSTMPPGYFSPPAPRLFGGLAWRRLPSICGSRRSASWAQKRPKNGLLDRAAWPKGIVSLKGVHPTGQGTGLTGARPARSTRDRDHRRKTGLCHSRGAFGLRPASQNLKGFFHAFSEDRQVIVLPAASQTGQKRGTA